MKDKELDKIKREYRDSIDILRIEKEMRYCGYGSVERVYRLDKAVELSVKALRRQTPFKLKDKEGEVAKGICKCGREVEISEDESYCKYCGQRIVMANG